MKKGIINICFMLFGIVIIFVLTFVYMLYFQVGNIDSNIKEELYYALMNTKLELDKEDLSYANFNVDTIKLDERLNEWAIDTKNSQINVNKIEVEELETKEYLDKFVVKVKLKVTFIPLVKIQEKLSFYIEDEIDLKLLKYN